MASCLARQAFLSLRRPPQLRVLPSRRTIHSTPIVFKKQKPANLDDLFDDLEIVDESTQEQQAKSQASSGSNTSDPPTPKTRGRVKRRLNPEERSKTFDQIASFMTPRLGRRPETKVPQIRTSAWNRLLQLATSEEQLKQVAGILPKWKDSHREFKPEFSELFVRRCQELRCPLLALQVYGDFAKYNLPLTLPAARQLLHALHRIYSIEDVITASALYGLYSLPPVSQDLVSAAIIVDACLTNNSDYSNRISEELIPQLRLLLKKTPVDTDDNYHRSNVWVQKAVENINKVLREREVKDLGEVRAARTLVVKDVAMDTASQPQVS